MNGYLKLMLISGITQVVIGTLCCVFGMLDAIAFCREMDIITCIMPGLWTGLMFVIAGVNGILACRQNRARRTRRETMIIYYMCCSIISSVLAAILITGYSMNTLWRSNYSIYSVKKGFKLATSILLLAFGMAEFGVSISASILCCTGVCGQRSEATPAQVRVMYRVPTADDGAFAASAKTGGPMEERGGTPEPLLVKSPVVT